MADSDKKISDYGEGTVITNERLNNLLNSMSKCKIEFINEKEECKKIREINSKLEVELKEARELEKCQRYHLLSSREMIGNLQDTVSQLIHVKRDLKKIKEEIISRDSTISTLEKDKENLILKHKETLTELRKNHEKHIEELIAINERKFQQVQNESDTQVAQFTCANEMLRNQIKEMEDQNRDKINLIVLECEEKIQRGASHIAQLTEQLSRQAARTDANIGTYKRRLEELEEKLKQSQFKSYLAQNTYRSQYDTQVERPFSAQKDYQDSIPTVTHERFTPKMTQNKGLKQNTLQVMYSGNETPTAQAPNNKGLFTITKKRKLYNNNNDFQDF